MWTIENMTKRNNGEPWLGPCWIFLVLRPSSLQCEGLCAFLGACCHAAGNEAIILAPGIIGLRGVRSVQDPPCSFSPL